MNFNDLKKIYYACGIILLAELLFSAKSIDWQALRVSSPLEGSGTTDDPLTIDLPALFSSGDHETADKHFFGANLSANADHTHSANKKNTTINNLGRWDMLSGSGVVHQSEFLFDSTLFNFETSGDINVTADDDLTLYSGGTLTLTTSGDCRITSLATDNSPVALIGISGSDILAKVDYSQSSYTPTVSSSANLDASPTMYTAYYTQIGNMVYMAGTFTADPASNQWDFRTDIPVDSDFDTDYEAPGVFYVISPNNSRYFGGSITSRSGSSELLFTAYSDDLESRSYSYFLSYRIVL